MLPDNDHVNVPLADTLPEELISCHKPVPSLFSVNEVVREEFEAVHVPTSVVGLLPLPPPLDVLPSPSSPHEVSVTAVKVIAKSANRLSIYFFIVVAIVLDVSATNPPAPCQGMTRIFPRTGMLGLIAQTGQL